MTNPALAIPVTLLTGFLGSGKTTVLNHLIRDPGMGRVAVIINEFGDIGLDHDLIEQATEEMILLQSGCLCCTIRGDLVTAMMALLRRRAAGEVAFDRVMIETTGLADPAPILHTLFVESELAQAFRLDGVVTTACAATGSPHANIRQPPARHCPIRLSRRRQNHAFESRPEQPRRTARRRHRQ